MEEGILVVITFHFHVFVVIVVVVISDHFVYMVVYVVDPMEFLCHMPSVVVGEPLAIEAMLAKTPATSRRAD